MDEIRQLINTINTIEQTVVAVIAAFVFLLGVIQCFFGLKLFKIQLAFTAFFSGFFIGLILFTIITRNPLVGLAFGLATGIVLAILSFKIFQALVFVQLFCISFVPIFLLFLFIDIVVGAMVGAYVGIIIGVWGAFFTKHVIIFSTCISGAIMIGKSFYDIFGTDDVRLIALGIIVAGIFAIVGVLIQFRTNRDGIEKSMVLKPTRFLIPIVVTIVATAIFIFIVTAWHLVIVETPQYIEFPPAMPPMMDNTAPPAGNTEAQNQIPDRPAVIGENRKTQFYTILILEINQNDNVIGTITIIGLDDVIGSFGVLTIPSNSQRDVAYHAKGIDRAYALGLTSPLGGAGNAMRAVSEFIGFVPDYFVVFSSDGYDGAFDAIRFEYAVNHATDTDMSDNNLTWLLHRLHDSVPRFGSLSGENAMYNFTSYTLLYNDERNLNIINDLINPYNEPRTSGHLRVGRYQN
jgi:hypothetical protein